MTSIFTLDNVKQREKDACVQTKNICDECGKVVCDQHAKHTCMKCLDM